MQPTEIVSSCSGEPSTTVLVRYFAAARSAAGVDTELIGLAYECSIADVSKRLRSLHPMRLPAVLDAASFLLDGVAVRDPCTRITDGAQLDVLPPFAGG